jgi:hypothetical protein
LKNMVLWKKSENALSFRIVLLLNMHGRSVYLIHSSLLSILNSYWSQKALPI